MAAHARVYLGLCDDMDQVTELRSLQGGTSMATYITRHWGFVVGPPGHARHGVRRRRGGGQPRRPMAGRGAWQRAPGALLWVEGGCKLRSYFKALHPYETHPHASHFRVTNGPVLTSYSTPVASAVIGGCPSPPQHHVLPPGRIIRYSLRVLTSLSIPFDLIKAAMRVLLICAALLAVCGKSAPSRLPRCLDRIVIDATTDQARPY